MSKTQNLASRMNRRINLQTATVIANSAGGFTTTWNTTASVWAEIKQEKGKEIFDSDQVEDVQYAIFTIRYIEGILPSMRIQHCNDYYNIRSIVNTGMKNVMLEILGERTDI